MCACARWMKKTERGIVLHTYFQKRKIKTLFKTNIYWIFIKYIFLRWVFEIYSEQADIIKGCKTDSSGTVVQGNHKSYR